MPLTCIVHHRPALCTMVHKGDLTIFLWCTYPLCTTKPGGAQHRSMVHSIVLYPQGGAQRSSHKHRHTGPILLPRPLTQKVIKRCLYWTLSVTRVTLYCVIYCLAEPSPDIGLLTVRVCCVSVFTGIEL